MNARDWILKLKKDGVLVEDSKDGKLFLHLNTPCKIHLTENATKQLLDEYVPHVEKGGFLVAIPARKNGVTHLTIDTIMFLKNVADAPERSYLADRNDENEALRATYAGIPVNSLPLQFHTHPTRSDNTLFELFSYLMFFLLGLRINYGLRICCQLNEPTVFA